MLASNSILANRYRVVRPLGGGGMKQVYLAEDVHLDNRFCALAEMIDSFADPREAQAAAVAFQREADLLAHLNHERIVRVYDRFSAATRHYLVMEYVEGESLEQRLAVTRSGQLSEKFVIDTALQILEAFEYLHGLTPPIVYRDLKPANVMITAGGRVKLIDFGIARFFIAKKTATMVGTQGYAPPEQYEGKAESRSDLYSLGATMFHLLTGWNPAEHPPFMFPPIESLRAEIKPGLAGLISESMELDPTHRIATAAEFRRRLSKLHEPPAPSARYDAATQVPAQSPMLEVTAPIAAAATTVPCLQCTRPIPFDARFCPYCRTNLENHESATAPSRPNRRVWLVGIAGIVASFAATGFAATIVYNNPSLQSALGIKPFVDNLPWKRAERLAVAREHPLKFEQLTLALSTRTGQPTAPPATSFKETDIASAQYLRWTATFGNGLAGLGSGSEKIDARFYDAGGDQIASSESEQFLPSNEKTIDFSAVVLIPDTVAKAPGQYTIALYHVDEMLGQQQFVVIEDLAAAPKPERLKKRSAFTVSALPATRHRTQPLPQRTPYHIELDSIFTQSEANTMLDRIRSLGYTASTTPVDQGGDETLYRVEVGAYKSEDEANDAAEELHSRYNSTFSTPPD